MKKIVLWAVGGTVAVALGIAVIVIVYGSAMEPYPVAAARGGS